jgi:hypothetical protein
LSDDLFARWTGTGWAIGVMAAARVEVGGVKVVGERRPAIVAPSGGTVIDTTARTAISEILQALRSHGLIAT